MTDIEKFDYIMMRAKAFLLSIDVDNCTTIEKNTFIYEMLLLRDEGISTYIGYKVALMSWLVELKPLNTRTAEERKICRCLRLM